MAHLRGEQRARYVAQMFGRISHRYDLLNTVMSAGRHYAWRRLAVELATTDMTGPALDVASGTGDFAVALAGKPAITRIIGLDFTKEMLQIAVRKSYRKGLADRLTFLVGDAHLLPFRNDQFICVTVGFGIRNFVDFPRALQEMARVVQPSGRVVVMEIVRTDGDGLFSRAFPLYFRHVSPWMGFVLAGDREAYTYLPKSVQHFHSTVELAAAMEHAGLRIVSIHEMALGAVAIIVGERPC